MYELDLKNIENVFLCEKGVGISYLYKVLVLKKRRSGNLYL